MLSLYIPINFIFCFNEGFYNSYKEVAPEIVPVVQDQMKKYPDYTLASTG